MVSLYDVVSYCVRIYIDVGCVFVALYHYTCECISLSDVVTVLVVVAPIVVVVLVVSWWWLLYAFALTFMFVMCAIVVMFLLVVAALVERSCSARVYVYWCVILVSAVIQLCVVIP